MEGDPYDDNTSSVYSASTVRSLLDGMTAPGGELASVASAINTIKVRGSDSDIEVDAKLYLPSFSEVEHLNNTKPLAAKEDWWLRTPSELDPDYPLIVTGGPGWVYTPGASSSFENGVRPALQLNLSAVAFSPESKTFSLHAAATGVTLNENSATFHVEDVEALTATVSPEGAVQSVKWSVGGTDAGAVKLYSDEACTTEVGTDAGETLTVYMRGESEGSATVTATATNGTDDKADNVSASCEVTVVGGHGDATDDEAILTFDLAGGTLSDADGAHPGTYSVRVNIGETVKLPAAPTRDGYTFQYWEGSRYDAGAEYKVTGDLTSLAAIAVIAAVGAGAIFVGWKRRK